MTPPHAPEPISTGVLHRAARTHKIPASIHTYIDGTRRVRLDLPDVAWALDREDIDWVLADRKKGHWAQNRLSTRAA